MTFSFFVALNYLFLLPIRSSLGLVATWSTFRQHGFCSMVVRFSSGENVKGKEEVREVLLPPLHLRRSVVLSIRCFLRIYVK